MLGNFVYENPTKLYFGEKALTGLEKELKKYGKKIMLIYGGGSIKKSGLYDNVMTILKENNNIVVEDAGVMPNPTVDKLLEGAAIAREHEVDLILAVGGGSVIDYAKAVSVSAHCEENPWDKYFLRMEPVSNKIIPVASVLTMVGTGSEMNGGSVITHTQTQRKIGRVFGPDVFPKFSILNPVYTFTVPHYQMVAGFYDIMSHIMEQYFSGEDDTTSDYIAEGLMCSLIHSSRLAVKDPKNYEARSNIMWTATWALNNLIRMGKPGDWMVHMIGQAISGVTDATHGMTLAAVSLPYYKLIMKDGLHKFKRYAINVWKVDPCGKTDEEIAEEGLAALKAWMLEIGVVIDGALLGVTADNIGQIADGTFILKTGYKELTQEEVVQILKDTMGQK